MALKPVVSQEELAALPEAVRGHYAERDGKLTLALDGQLPGFVPESEHASTRAKLNEFRDTNIRVLKERDELTGKLKIYEGIDPEEYRSLKAGREGLKKKGVEAPDDIEALIARHVQAAVKPLQERIGAHEQERTKLRGQLEAKEVETRITEAAVAAGVLPDLLPDVLERARKTFQYRDGKVVAMNGDQPVYGRDGEKPLTVEEWLPGLPKPFFKPSSGGGADGAKGARPNVRQLVNPTPAQMGENIDAIIKGDVVVVRK